MPLRLNFFYHGDTECTLIHGVEIPSSTGFEDFFLCVLCVFVVFFVSRIWSQRTQSVHEAHKGIQNVALRTAGVHQARNGVNVFIEWNTPKNGRRIEEIRLIFVSNFFHFLYIDC